METDKFVVDSLNKANWAIKAIRKHKANIANYQANCESLIAEYKARIEYAYKICDENCEADKRAIDYLTERLLEFTSNNLPNGKRSIKLPEGTLKFSKTPPKFYFDDGSEPSANSQKLLDYLQKNNADFIKTRYVANWADFKRLLDFGDDGNVFNKDTGEVITELHALPSADKFTVETKEFNDENSNFQRQMD